MQSELLDEHRLAAIKTVISKKTIFEERRVVRGGGIVITNLVFT